MNVLVTGANGQLGTSIRRVFLGDDFEVFPVAHEDLSIEYPSKVRSFLKGTEANVLINCAAFHNPKSCEEEPMTALEINAVAPFADYIVVVKDSNKDGRFTKIAEEKGIAFTEVNYALNIVQLMKQVFVASTEKAK